MKRPILGSIFLFLLVASGSWAAVAQNGRDSRAELGSQIARNGFKNEDEIRDKFNNWKVDKDAQNWLGAMGYKLADVENVSATKPHGEKADVEVKVKTAAGEKTQGISIKLVSGKNGFNQIDKRWLSHYVTMWRMPADVETALKYFLGEVIPDRPGRDPQRMYLDELDAPAQKAVVDFFAANRAKILHDLFTGDGPHAAGWVMVALKSTDKPRWVLRSDSETIRFFGEGKIEITAHGNLKIGRITMQRKGGDGGRETARMMQFKINPALLFEAK